MHMEIPAGQKEKEQESIISEVQMEMGECDKGFFPWVHAQGTKREGPEEQDQSKCPWSGMSPRAVSFNNPGLPCVELRCPHNTGLGVNAHTLTGRQSVSQNVSTPHSRDVELKLFQSMQLYSKEFLFGHGNMCKSCAPWYSGPSSKMSSQLNRTCVWAHTNTLHFSNRSSAPSSSSSTQMPARSCWTQVPLSHCVKKAPTHCCSVTGRVNDVGRWRGCAALSAAYRVAVFGPLLASWRVTYPGKRNAVTDVPSDASIDSNSSSA